MDYAFHMCNLFFNYTKILQRNLFYHNFKYRLPSPLIQHHRESWKMCGTSYPQGVKTLLNRPRRGYSNRKNYCFSRKFQNYLIKTEGLLSPKVTKWSCYLHWKIKSVKQTTVETPSEVYGEKAFIDIIFFSLRTLPFLLVFIFDY